MAETWFVTGTDTGVGKTFVATALLLAARARGRRTLGIKPVASGCAWIDGELRNEDALAMQAAMTEPLGYAEINPVALEPAIAPHVAAREAGVELRVEALAAHCRAVLARPHDFALVEGAGGWRVPLNATETLADLAIALRTPVILVVGMRLGCINHALLSAEAIRADGLRLAGWVANHVEADFPRADASFDTLAAALAAPCLGRVPYQPRPSAADVAGYLDLGALGA